MSVEQAFDVASPGDQFSEVLKSCDVVNTSHDIELDLQKLLGEGWPDGKIVCDISAFGRAGPLARQPASDFEVPALAGLIDTTGDAGVPASRIAVSATECLACRLRFRQRLRGQRTLSVLSVAMQLKFLMGKPSQQQRKQ